MRVMLAVLLVVVYLMSGSTPPSQAVEYPCDADLYAAIAAVAQRDTYPEGGSPRYSAFTVSRYVMEHWGYDDPARSVVKVTRGNKTLLALGVNGNFIICDKGMGWKQMLYRERPGYYRVASALSQQTAVRDCLPLYDTARFTPHTWREPRLDPTLLPYLKGWQIAWLGYGDGQALGIKHGFKGVDVGRVIPIGDVFFYQDGQLATWQLDHKTLTRLNVAYYPSKGRYITSAFTKDSHIPDHPDNGICMFWLDKADWERVFHD